MLLHIIHFIMKFRYFTTVLFLIGLVLSGLSAQNLPSVTRIGHTNPSVSAFVMGAGEQLSGQQFQTDGILTYHGYQYAVYYNLNRNVCIARRKLPLGSWQEVVLPYRNSVDDAHNTISIGISAKDGRIHLSYDHHNDPLRYCYSVKGSANDPDNMPWNASAFSTTTSIMDKAIPNVTYPRFISKPDGNLLFECRFRWSGFGDSYLREYNADTQTWSLIGRYLQGEDFTPDACAYINGMSYDKFGRLHVTWCWRDDFGGGSNHDFYYAYSEDHGRTWKDTFNQHKATTDVMDPVADTKTGGALGQTKKSFMIEAIPYNRGYINQETQDVDSRGRIHAVNSHIPDGQASDSNWGSARTKARLHHRFRKEDGTWVKRLITVNGNSINSTRRVHLAIDSYDNAYIIANNVGVLMAASDDDYATWKLISEDGKTGVLSEPLADKPLLREKGVLSFVYLGSDKRIYVFDHLTKNPNTPQGTGLLAEYYSNDNFSGLIRSQVVAHHEQIDPAVVAKSIRLSGTFETLLGETYKLHITTASKTHIYIDDKLRRIIPASANSTEYEITFPLIPSHKHNIVIETAGATLPVLQWSSLSTPKQSIPATSLYPVKSNTQPDAIVPPFLTPKAELNELLLGTKTRIQTSERQIISFPSFNPPTEYSIEVKARINSATGRGMDVEARSNNGKGFRFSLGQGSISRTTPLTANDEIAIVENSTEQVYRFAVKADQVHVYKGQEYLGARKTENIGNILADGTETASSGTYGPDLIGNWAGPGGTGPGLPTAYGWDATGATVPWNTANGTSGVRYLDVNTSTSPNHLLGNGVFTGRLLTIRWDGSLGSNVYYYPVTLEANKTYEFAMVYEHWNNGAIGAPITVGVSRTKTSAGIYQSATFATVERNRLQNATFSFNSNEAGLYYITFTGASGTMYGIGNLQLRSVTYNSSLIIGKNYPGGSADFDLFYVTYQEGAYAPSSEIHHGPDLPVKKTLPVQIQQPITMQSATGSKDIKTIDFNPLSNYSVEIAATVNQAVGRGLDLELVDGYGQGFRTALSAESLRWASPFSSMRELSRVDNGSQIIRYAVQGNQAHVYLNGKFLESMALSQIGNMNAAGTLEVLPTILKPTGFYDGINLIANADFRNDVHNAAPSGWLSDRTMGASPNSRVQEKSQTTELSAYQDGKKAFMFRFDASGGSYYSYPVILKNNQWHEYSFDLITWGENAGVEFDVLIATSADGNSGVIHTQRVKTPAVRATAARQMVRFFTASILTIPQQEYYLVFKRVATVGTIAVTDLYLKEGGLNRLLFGKNYTDGTASFQVDYITVDYSGAFAPQEITSNGNIAAIDTPNVFVSGRQLIIRNLNDHSVVSVYDIMGRKVLQQLVKANTFSTFLNEGIFIIRVNEKTTKITVK